MEVKMNCERGDINQLKRTDTEFVDGSAEQEQEQTTFNVDDEMIRAAVRLLETYSTKQLDQLMRSSRQPHLMAYVEYTLNRKESTFRNMSVKEVFPLVIQLNEIANHQYSDDDSDSD